MLIFSATILCLIALTNTATIQQRNIPVEVRYEEPVFTDSVRNLNERIQLSPGELKEAGDGVREELEEKPEEIFETEKRTNAIKNLEEKVQLSPEELDQVLKHVPLLPEEILTAEESVPLKKLGELPQIEEITQEPYREDIRGILQQVEGIISNGLKKLRLSFKPHNDQLAPNPQQWEDLDKAVNEYLNEEKIKLQLKQGEPTTPSQIQTFFQTIATGFQTVANNFVQNLSQANNGNTTQSDEQQGGPFQGFVNYFQGGVNNIANAINSLGNQGPTTSNTVLGDDATTQAPGFISNFVNNVQQLFGQIQGAAQGVAPGGTQGDTGVSTTPGPGPVQVIQSIGSAITNLIQGTKPPNASGDEGTAPTESSNNNIIQSIGSAIQNSPLNPFRPQGQSPGDTGATTQNPIQVGISGVQSVGNQIQQLVSGQGGTTESSKKKDEVPIAQNTQVTEQSVQKDEVSEKVNVEQNKEEKNQEEQKQDQAPAEEIKQKEENQEVVKPEEIPQEAEKQEQQVQEEIKQEEQQQEQQQEEQQQEEQQQEVNQEEQKQEEGQQQEEEVKQENEVEVKQEEQKQEETKQEEVERKEEILTTAE